MTASGLKSSTTIGHRRVTWPLTAWSFERWCNGQLDSGPHVGIQKRRQKRSIFLERQNTEPGTLHGDRLPVYQCDGNFSATNSLAGKVGKPVPNGIPEQAIEGRIRDVIQSAPGVQQIAFKAYSHGFAASVGSTEGGDVPDRDPFDQPVPGRRHTHRC